MNTPVGRHENDHQTTPGQSERLSVPSGAEVNLDGEFGPNAIRDHDRHTRYQGVEIVLKDGSRWYLMSVNAGEPAMISPVGRNEIHWVDLQGVTLRTETPIVVRDINGQLVLNGVVETASVDRDPAFTAKRPVGQDQTTQARQAPTRSHEPPSRSRPIGQSDALLVKATQTLTTWMVGTLYGDGYAVSQRVDEHQFETVAGLVDSIEERLGKGAVSALYGMDWRRALSMGQPVPPFDIPPKEFFEQSLFYLDSALSRTPPNTGIQLNAASAQDRHLKRPQGKHEGVRDHRSRSADASLDEIADEIGYRTGDQGAATDRPAIDPPEGRDGLWDFDR